ncbi:transglycosylase SLT domain-containing protein [Streptomyces sp. NPDC087420]|uniref:transglycosylase SLT domain-containing protein n=1 Tax=Streptomyces sp. NPDC087420 TaxID=3365785 RepID=UPI00383796E3
MASLMSILQQAGFKGAGLQMAYAIAMAESGGNAKAHNGNAGTGDNSYGLFQINMLGAMGPERRKQYGLSSNEALYDALTNAKVAYKMSKGGTSWGPWSTYGNGAYKQYYGGSGATVTSSGSGGGTTTTMAKLSSSELAEQYGLTSALINSSGELKSLFNKAVSGSWSAARFQASLKNTKWWKTQSSSLRKYLTTKYTDPATWKQQREAAGATLKAMGIAVGVAPSFLVKDGKWTSLLNDVVYKKVALGWTDARIKDYLGTKTTSHDGIMYGEAGEAFDKLHEVAYLNGMKYSTYYATAARAIVSGKSTLETEEAKIRAQAAGRYSAYAEQIKAGQNVMDLAAPYIKSVATILESPETDIDLFNAHIAKAMTAKPTAGAAQGSQMPLWQFENDLRADPLWKKTNNSRESIMTVARQVARDFGVAY